MSDGYLWFSTEIFNLLQERTAATRTFSRAMLLYRALVLTARKHNAAPGPRACGKPFVTTIRELAQLAGPSAKVDDNRLGQVTECLSSFVEFGVLYDFGKMPGPDDAITLQIRKLERAQP